ncbi:hypothetical protein MHC_01640 [Mycoplasma haemocanis str. Illinois]|uniref:Uncharacterized protein n=1 Tax=Mycoplasma haemocanis (strain Illinois) TaxID=1111676 RepID=H6N6C2_MYCHN|nr:hypothetical protein [Mycoplasma haemocanis]AEW45194.1 hypothetical protein MHC_01640 [Mycoplasma haemocanis str. Illinois]
MSLPIKASLGVVALTGTIGGGILVNNYFTKNSGEPKKTLISKRLESEGYVLLDVNKDAEWTNTVNKHKETNFTYPRFSLKASQELIDLKKECQRVLNVTNNEEDYKKAKKWCVKPMSVKDLISSKKLTLLKVQTNDNSNKQEFQSLVERYEKEGNGNNAIKGLSLEISGNKDNNWSKLRDKCRELSEKEFWSMDYDDEVLKVEMWCINEAVKGG